VRVQHRDPLAVGEWQKARVGVQVCPKLLEAAQPGPLPRGERENAVGFIYPQKWYWKPSMSTVRTFVAVETSPGVIGRAGQLIERLKAADAKVSWVRGANLHWTVKFLGNIELTEVAEVCRAVTAAARQVPPFELEVRGAGAFPRIERPRTVWLGAGEGNEQMSHLAASVESHLAKIGFRSENRRFLPHITLGRVRGGRNLDELGEALQEYADFDAGTMHVDEVVVFSSRLEADGAVYEALGRAPLG